MSDQDPVWDGTGQDPWLTARLEATVEIATAEGMIRTEVWSSLSEWLVATRRSVLSGIRPDPIAVFTHTRQWREAVARIVAGPIRDTVAQAYHTLLGPGYQFDSRPAVVDHLATVTNRMVRTQDDAFSLVSSQIAKGVEAGESIPQLAARVEEVLDTTATPRWANRATVIARTEALGALNAGRSDSFAAVAEELDEEMESVWLATIDRRTRRTHREADGQRVPVGTPFTVGGVALRYPGDPAGPGREVIQCRCTTLLMEPGETTDLTHRQFADY